MLSKYIIYITLLFYYFVCVVGLGFGPDCPPDATLNEQKVPDPNDCTKYSKCSFWFSAKFSCKNGEHFSPTELECMDPCNAGCDSDYECDHNTGKSKNDKCYCKIENNNDDNND